MCVGVKNRLVTCEKCMFWSEKRYKWILALGSYKTHYWPNWHFPADLATFTEEVLNGNLHFLFSKKPFIYNAFDIILASKTKLDKSFRNS